MFGRNELVELFAEWKVHDMVFESFAAPGDTLKKFCSVIVAKSK